MLDALKDYAEKQQLVVAPGFASKDIRWALDCAPDGRFLTVISLGEGKKGEVFPGCPSMNDSQLKTGGQIRSQVLWESAKVVLDWAEEDERKDRDTEKHEFFLGMLDSAGESVPEFKHAAKMLRLHRKAVIEAMKEAKAKPTDKVTVALSGQLPLRGDGWHAWWRKWFQANCAAADSGDAQGGMLCLMTGALTSPAMTHDKVTKLRDTGSFGGVLAAFDKDAFTSFGLEQGQNAAMSPEMASLYPKALDHLLANHSRSLGPVQAVVWFNRTAPAEAGDVLGWLYEGSQEGIEADARLRARKFLESVKAGQRGDLGTNEYHCLMLSGSPARVVVRAWMSGRLEDLAGSVDTWFKDLSIARRDGQGLAEDPKFFAVLGSTKAEADDFLAHSVLQLWNCAVQRAPIPRELMAKALRRFRSLVMKDETVLHAGISLIKAFHLREGDKHMQAHLNAEHPAAEYQCGRLLAVLSALQGSALGDVGAGVVQRFYGSASQTPRTVLGALVRNSNHHLAKLEGGLRHWYQGKIAEIVGRLGDDLPKTLTLEQQSLFALGYYQQMAADRAGKGKKDNSKNDNGEVNQ
jgi:CRISPR-associated protein Csd1